VLLDAVQFSSWSAALAAFHRAATAIGCVYRSNGKASVHNSNNVTIVDPPFEPWENLAGGGEPLLAKRLACIHRHDSSASYAKKLHYVMEGTPAGNTKKQRHTPNKGTKCRNEIVIWSDGTRVRFTKKISKRTASGSSTLHAESLTARQLIEFIKNDHTHDVVPDIGIISTLPSARSIPTDAIDNIKQMRQSGMTVASIFNAVKVILISLTFTLHGCHSCVTCVTTVATVM
jgi:hypothetical protein